MHAAHNVLGSYRGSTADGAVDLTDVQLQGKKRMDVKAFLAGFREPQEYKTSAGTSKSEIERNVPTEY